MPLDNRRKSKYTFAIMYFVGILALASSCLFLGRIFFHEVPVKIGDSKSAVLSKMGRPVAIFTNGLAILKFGGEVWAYGQECDCKALVEGNFPIRLRLIAPDADDFIITFDHSGSVKTIQRPDYK
jgi:hypothetical protein